MKRQPVSSGNATLAVIEWLDGGVFVFEEALIADIGPYYDGVDLSALIIDLADWYAAHPAQRARRSVLMQDLAHLLTGWITMNKYQLFE